MCSPVLLLPFIAPALILPFDTLLKCTPSLLLCSTGAHSRRSIAICSWCRGADNSLFYLSLSSTKGPGHWSNASRMMAAQQAAFCTLLRGWREEGRIQQWLKIQGLYWQTYTQKIHKIWFSKFLLHYELKMAVVTSYVQLLKKKARWKLLHTRSTPSGLPVLPNWNVVTSGEWIPSKTWYENSCFLEYAWSGNLHCPLS